MKRSLLLLLFVIPAFSYAQQTPWAVGLGYYSSGNCELEVSVRWEEHRFHLGTTFGSKGGPYEERVSELITDGSAARERTEYYVQTVDFGYSRFLTDRFNLRIDFSIGTKTHFTDYSQDTPDGKLYFSYIHSRRLAIGGGMYLGYFLTNWLEIYGGYSSLREAGGGVRFSI